MEQALAIFEPEYDVTFEQEEAPNKRWFWNTRELRILNEKYPLVGPDGCVGLLPGRSRRAICTQAHALGLSAPRVPQKRAKYETSEQIDAIITRTYQNKPTSGSVARCAMAVNRPRWWVTRRAQDLGLSLPRFKRPDWSELEDDIICRNAHKHSRTIQKSLAKRGFTRSETAITVRLKRLNQSRRDDPDHYTANELAKLLGVSVHPVIRYINSGWLKASKRKSGRGPQTEPFRIHRRDVRQFIIENASVVDLRKVDPTWFIDLLGEKSKATGPRVDESQEFLCPEQNSQPRGSRMQSTSPSGRASAKPEGRPE